MGKFIVRNGDLEGRKFRLESGAKITLGRERADINFFDKRMSRRHCTLEVRDGVDFAVDMESTNGTWVNNQRIREAELQAGDLVRVGFTELEYLGNPEPTMPVFPTGPVPVDFNPNQTIAFRAKELLRPPPVERRKRFQGKSRLNAAKSAAMGKKTGERQYISAKGKFCEACGEAIFVKEGAPDEGKVVDGIYLCRMCALISAKQKELGKDGLMPSFARIVGGRMGGAPADDAPPPDSEAPMEITEEEVSLDDLIGPDASAAENVVAGAVAGAAAGTAAGTAEGRAPVQAPSDAAAVTPDASPGAPDSGAPMEIIAEEVSLEDFIGPDEGEETVKAGDDADVPAAGPAPPEASPDALRPAPDALPEVSPETPPDAPATGAPMEIVVTEEEEAAADGTAHGSARDVPAKGDGPGPDPGEEHPKSANALAFLDEMLRSEDDAPGTGGPPPVAEAPAGDAAPGPDGAPREVELPPGSDGPPAAKAGDARPAGVGPAVESLKLPDDIRFETEPGGQGDGMEGSIEPKHDGDNEEGDGPA